MPNIKRDFPCYHPVIEACDEARTLVCLSCGEPLDAFALLMKMQEETTRLYAHCRACPGLSARCCQCVGNMIDLRSRA